MTADDHEVFFTSLGTLANNYNDGSVAKVPVGGGQVTTIASAELLPYYVVADATSVYWTSPINAGIEKAPRAGGARTSSRPPRVASRDHPQRGHRLLDRGHELHGPEHLHGGRHGDPTRRRAESPSGIIADRGDVFFTNAGNGTSDGSVVEVPGAGGAARVLASGYTYPFGIAVDASYVYVAVGGAANVSAGSIMRIAR